MARGDGSLWLQPLADLRRRLELRAFDRHLPGELALVEEDQVSKHTVRQALRVLREEGVLVAARGRAPRLAEPVEIAQPIGAIYSLFESVQASGLEQRSMRDGPTAALDPGASATPHPQPHGQDQRPCPPERAALDTTTTEDLNKSGLYGFRGLPAERYAWRASSGKNPM
jgi:predicted transcriptional regulator